MKQINKTAVTGLLAAATLMPILIGCERNPPNSLKPEAKEESLRRNSQGREPPPKKVDAPREYNSQFVSASGGYSLPLNCATSAAVVVSGSSLEQKVTNEFIKKHSAKNLWTYIMNPYTSLVQQQTKVMDPARAGSDKLERMYGENPAKILTIWSPIESADIKKDFSESIQIFKGINAWVNDSESEITLDGNKGMRGRYKVSLGNITMYSTFMIVYANENRYQIVFSYTGGFNDPEDTLSKISQIKFSK